MRIQIIFDNKVVWPCFGYFPLHKSFWKLDWINNWLIGSLWIANHSYCHFKFQNKVEMYMIIFKSSYGALPMVLPIKHRWCLHFYHIVSTRNIMPFRCPFSTRNISIQGSRSAQFQYPLFQPKEATMYFTMSINYIIQGLKAWLIGWKNKMSMVDIAHLREGLCD